MLGTHSMIRGPTMSLRLLAIVLLADALPAVAAPAADSTAEIAHLFAYLGSSNCSFERNGTWHDAPKAVDHLRTKYAYLSKKGLVTSAESFIELGASRSSMSGRAYLVRCGTAAPVEAARWFMAELARHREAKRRHDGQPANDAIIAPPQPEKDSGGG